MRQLQLTPPLIVLVMGYPGSGKTFFARQFAEQFSLVRISDDVIRFELFEQPQFSKEEAEIIGRMRNYALSEVLKTKQTVVVEGTFLTSAERKSVYEIAKSAGYRTLVVWLQTDLQTSAVRATRRDRRNPDSKYAFALNKQQFESIRVTLQRPSEREDSVVISGKHAFKSQSLTVIKKIATSYSEQLLSTQTSNSTTDSRVIRGNKQLIQ